MWHPSAVLLNSDDVIAVPATVIAVPATVIAVPATVIAVPTTVIAGLTGNPTNEL